MSAGDALIAFTAITKTSIAHAEFIGAMTPLILLPLGALMFEEHPNWRALRWGGHEAGHAGHVAAGVHRDEQADAAPLAFELEPMHGRPFDAAPTNPESLPSRAARGRSQARGPVGRRRATARYSAGRAGCRPGPGGGQCAGRRGRGAGCLGPVRAGPAGR